MAKLFATDLDGTLMYPPSPFRCIPKKNVKFLRHWIDEGNKVVLITSRSIEFMDRLKEEIRRPFDSITCTSSVIQAGDEIIRDEHMSNEDLISILGEIEHEYKPLAYLLTTNENNLVIKNLNVKTKFLVFLYQIYWRFQFKRREDYILDNDVFDQQIKEAKVYKIMLFFGLGRNKGKLSKEINTKLREKYPHIESSWSKIIIELTPKDCNKGYGLEYYCQHQGIKEENVYCVGDSGNDISMFKRYHSNACCMKHALPAIKKYAKYSISRVHKLEKILLNKEEK